MKGNALYAILPRWPSQPVRLESVRTSAKTEVTMLGLDGSLKWTTREDGIAVVPPAILADELPCEYAYTLKVTHVQSE